MLTYDFGISSEHLAGDGPIEALEQRLRGYFDVPFAVATSNATATIFSIFAALGLRRKKFFTTPLTYGATISGPLLLENAPVFVDVDPTTLCISPDVLESCIRRHPDAVAILSVDYLGVPADMRALRDLADEHGLWLISDASQSLGARDGDRPASFEADAIVLSFTHGKSVNAGEGGAMVTRDEEIFKRMVYWSQHPLRQKRVLGALPANEFGFNARMHPYAAEMANANWVVSMLALERKQQTCIRILDNMAATKAVDVPDYRGRGIVPSFFRLAAFWSSRPAPRRIETLLGREGFQVQVSGLPAVPLYQHPAYQALVESAVERCPAAEAAFKRAFCIYLAQHDIA